MTEEEIYKAITHNEQLKKLKHRKKYRTSILDKYRSDIRSLYCHGQNFTDIQAILRDIHGICVDRTTVMRYIKKNAYFR